MAMLFGESGEESLDSIALRAEVSTQTVIRLFGGRAALLEQAAGAAKRLVVDQRSTVPVGDIVASIKVLLIHYETYGDRLCGARAREPRSPELRPGVVRELADHRRWVARTYRPQLDRAEDRGRVLNALTVLTDVGTWKLLRRDLEIDRREVEATLTAMVTALLGPGGQPPGSGQAA